MSENMEYSHQCVQTEGTQASSYTDSGSISETADDGSLDAEDIANVSVSSASSIVIHTRPPTPRSVDSGDESVEDDSPPATIHTVTRTLKRPQMVYLRPATLGAQTLKSTSARIVSLPETISKYSARQESSRRIVSMPEHGLLHLSPYSENDHFGPEDGSPARVRVRSVATDTPLTPSPPSSPDSVVFIANKSTLSDGFLRKKVPVTGSHTAEPREDEDWESWSKSPPRPIPALHGPLSLPYARCPSGAEGTIIEAQENLPRMIWGLEGENTTHRQRIENDAAQKQHAVSQATHQRSKPAVVSQPAPPRFHNQQLSRKAGNESERIKSMPPTSVIRRQLLTPEAEPQIPLVPPQVKLDSPEYHYAFPSHGPIDLSDLLRSRTGLAPDLHAKDSDFASNAAWGSLGDNPRSYSSTGDLNWQSLLLAQERLRNSLPSSFSGSGLNNYLHGFGSSGSLSSLATSRSPIVLDTPSQVARTVASQRSLSAQHTQSNLGTPASSHSSFQRMSALDIAQKYRQQQLAQQKQQQPMLPTPPSSSSSLWSAGFSPYQDSLLSPEFLNPVGLPGISARDTEMQRLTLLRQAEALQQLRSADHARLGISGRDAQSQMSLLAPAAQIQDYIGDTFDVPLVNNASYRPSLSGLHLHPQQAYTFSGAPLPLADPRRSPTYPRQHPNTPLGPIGSRVSARTSTFEPAFSVPVAPPSPPSPKQRLRNISQQNPRSIPLARLVQRLSSVPEEEANILSGRGHVPPGSREAASVRHDSMHGRPSTPAKSLPQSADYTRAKRRPAGGSNASANRHDSEGRKGSEPPRYAADEKSQPSRSAGASRENVASYSRAVGANGKEDNGPQRETSPSRGRRGNHRGRGGRGWRARRPNAANGPERAEGGLTVRS